MELEQSHEPDKQVPEQTRLPTNSSGHLRLTDWAIGAVDDPSLAQNCTQVLKAEGIDAQDICIVAGATALQQLQAAEQLEKAGHALHRLRDTALDAIREARPVRDVLEDEARAGHTLLGIHLPDSNQIDAIRNTLEEYQVHHLYLFEPTMITRLS